MARAPGDQVTRWVDGRRLETLGIGALILGMSAITILIADQVYLASLAVVSRPGAPIMWLWRPGEAGLGLVLGLAAAGWLTGVWLGEREPRGWAVLGLALAVVAAPLLLVLDRGLGATAPGSRFVPPGLAPDALWLLAPAMLLAGLVLGGVLGAWWAGQGPLGPEG